MQELRADFPSDVPDRPELVLAERTGDVMVLTLNRPEVMNCLSFPTLKRLRTLFHELAQDLTLRAIVLTGAGEKAFCAGADLKERREMPLERVPIFVKNIRRTMDDLEALPQPTLGAINGVAFGGGTELLLACDLRIAAPHAELGLTETSLAIIPGAGGTQRLPRLIGKARAKELILTAKKIGAERAERYGLVNEVAAPGKLLERALELARTIADNGPVAVRAAKRAIDLGTEQALTDGLETEARCYDLVIPTRDRLEALGAFAEKRKPRFEGR
ncbi:MAG: enoyl-CoA hydratase/isomerase family protein [Planctomycetes bacterium]|nr:enoyl-CoA hydratase/isomerase family protein [Planctomycetota bacterium]